MIKIMSSKVSSFLELRGWSQRDLAKELGYDESYISKILVGEAEPSKQFMKAIMGLTGAGMELFVYES